MRFELSKQMPRIPCRYLVLDRDMRPPSRGISEPKESMETFHKVCPDPVKIDRNDAKRHSAIKVDEPFDRGARNWFH